jgi:pilus assembly protein CpaF
MTPCYDESMEKVSLNFGPIDPLVKDETISEIMVNRFDKIFAEKEGKLQLTPFKFSSEQALQDLILNIAQFSGRQIGGERPFMDGYLPDGSRVNAVLPPMAPAGTSLTIRKFRKAPFTLEDYLQSGSLTDKAAYFLHACVIARVNIVVSGGTGTGKTTFLNALSGLIPPDERIITIEDVAELNLQHPNWVRLESVFYERDRAVSTRDCLINALRMRPDRIIVGECRRDETFEMLQAMNTGHDGSMTTVHANSSRDCLTRLESLILSANVEIPLPALRRQIASAIALVVQLKRVKNGQRVVQEIVELTGMEANTVTSQVLFTREKAKGIEPSGPDQLHTSGLVPAFMEKFADAAIQFPPNFFDPATKVTYQPD